MKPPLISIIIPVYKVEPYLKRCIDSVLCQTYTKLEIILVDDGSPDTCPQICDEYARKDNRIKVIHKENGGLADARNAGLDICNGEYIAFLDSDDWIAEDFVETVLQVAERENSDLVVGNHERFQEGDNPAKLVNNNRYVKITQYEALDYLYSDYGLNFTTSWGKLYKKHLWNNIRFPKGKLYEDAYVCHLLYSSASNICFIDAPFYKYHHRKDSIMGQTTDSLHALEPRMRLYAFLRQSDFKKLIPKYFEALIKDTSKGCTRQEYDNKFKQEILQTLITVTNDLCIYIQHKTDKTFFTACWNLFIAYAKSGNDIALEQQLLAIFKKTTQCCINNHSGAFIQKAFLSTAITFPQATAICYKIFKKFKS